MTRVGLVGCGHWGKLIARDLGVLGCEVSVVARSAESRQRALEARAAHVVETIESLSEQDAYVVASSTVLHTQHVAELLTRERPIFCEKPLGMSVRQLESLPAIANDLVFSMDKWRYHSGVKWLAECARSETLGPVQGLSLIRVNGVSKQSPVTAVWHLAPHDLAIALEVLGHVPEVRSSTLSRIGGWAYHAQVTLGTSPWVTINAGERRSRSYREVRLVCERGEATLSGAYADAIAVRRHSPTSLGELELFPIVNTMPLLDELSAFIAFVRGSGPPPKSSLAEATLIVSRLEEIHAIGGADSNATLW